MSSRPLKEIIHSLYARLFLVYGLTFILLITSIGLSFKIMRDRDQPHQLHQHIHQYQEYLTRDIGVPPDLEKAKALSMKLGFDLLIRKDGEQIFSSRPEFLAHCEDCFLEKKRHRCKSIHTIDKQNYSFSFSHPRFWRGPDHLTASLILAAIFVLIVLLISFRLVRRIFRPLKQMREVAERYKIGEWDARTEPTKTTELNELAATMNEMAERIERQLKSAKELLIAVSHELRSPLARMRLASESISDENTKSHLIDEIKMLDRITSSLLERERLSANPEDLRKENLDLSALTEEVCHVYGKRIQFSASEDNFLIEADKERIMLCLRNLIDNALKYSDEEIRVTLVKYKDRIDLSVEDSGIGISEDDLKHLGEPFFRSDSARTGDRKKGGFGLGLSLCRSIMNAHKGRIEFESKLGEGTRVSLVLPLP